tara:strand:+ start:331 stop:564 length:234 start_codon:yes stop_codon:yes gene_type:complete
MIDVTRVRYAVIVAGIGLAVALIPGLNDTLQEWVQSGSVIVAWLWTILRIAQEFVAPALDSREVDGGGFWATMKRAL